MKNILRGDAVAQAKLYRVTLSGFSAGTRFTTKINNKRITYESSSAEDAAEGMATLINASGYAEFQEVIASAVDNVLFLMARTAGQDFFVEFESQGSTTGIIQVTRSTAGHEVVNEVQKILLSAGTSGGTWTHTNDHGSGDETTSAIDWDATAAEVKAEFVSTFTDVDSADLDVVKIADGEWDLYWRGDFAAVEVPEGTINGASLTGTGSAVLTRTKIGRGLSNEVQMLFVQPSASTYQFRVIHGGSQLTGVLDNTLTAAGLKTALEGLSTIGADNVQVYGGDVDYFGLTGKMFFIVYENDLAGINVAALDGYDDHEFGCTVAGSLVSAGGQATSNAIHVVNLGLPSAGTWSLNDGVDSTGNLPYNPTLGAIESAMEGFAAFDAVTIWGNVNAVGVYAIEYAGSSADTEVDLLTLVSGGLTSESAASISNARLGEASVNETWQLVINGTGGTFDLSDGTDDSLGLAYNINAATLETEIETDLGAYPGVSVSGSGTNADPFVIVVTDPAQTDVNLLEADGSSLTGGSGTITEIVAHHAGANEVQLITIAAGVTGGTWPATILGVPVGPFWHDEPAAVVQAVFEDAIGAGNVTVTGSDGGPYTVTFLSTYANTPVDLIVVDGSDLVAGAGSELITVTLDQESRGPNHANDGWNWTLGRPPETGDDLILEDGNANLLYGMNWIREFTVDVDNDRLLLADHDFADEQKVRVSNSVTPTPDPPAGLAVGTDYYVIYVSKDEIMLSATRGGSPVNITDAGTGTHTVAVELNSFVDSARYTGLVGLPKRNTDGATEYYEYRNRKFRFGLLATGDKIISIGGGDGDGSGRMLHYTGTYQVEGVVYRTGSSPEDGVPAYQHEGVHADSNFTVYDGDAGFAFYSGESSQYNKISQSGGTVNFGQGQITAELLKTDGDLLSNGAMVNGVPLTING